MADVRALIVDVLERGYLLSLGTVDDAGPWVADVNFAFDDDLNVYWLSMPTVRHSIAVEKNQNVAGTITLCNNMADEKIGIQFAGTAEKIDEAPLVVGVRYATKKQRPVPTAASEMLNPGQSWYRLRPSKIDLVHQPLYGHEKKFLELP